MAPYNLSESICTWVSPELVLPLNFEYKPKPSAMTGIEKQQIRIDGT